jgi:hypothetical protein
VADERSKRIGSAKPNNIPNQNGLQPPPHAEVRPLCEAGREAVK